jgi:methyl-accepting chemotaxis protein
VQAANEKARVALLVFAIASLALGGALSVWLVRSITRPIQQAVRAANRIAELDLTETIQSHGRDETGRLLKALDSMQRALKGLVAQVRTSTDSINVASSEIADGNMDLSSRTEEASSSLQQTAAAIEQMNGTVQQSAHSARTARDLASASAEVAVRGGAVVARVVSTMEEINGSSRKISDIIGVIDGIAFQTNILALNAAVEAARAGEQGRGFAVVAAEVRSLAQRSASAAREIKGLITQSVEKVELGTQLVADAGATMTEVVDSAQRVSVIIGEITHAATEQSAGIGQVNTAVAQLDQVTQQNAALVEESAAAAESLKQQARHLAETVQRFRIAG